MPGMPHRFRIRRFATVFLVALLALAAGEYLASRGGTADLASVLLRSGISALLAASVSTYWSYERACAFPARSRRDPPAEARPVPPTPYGGTP